ncbi:MAG: type VI secretion system baseplate subunit TssF [Desulfobacteraceae bacterium]|nr:type VI secretion system baseplate subunit TssF [Desulfobacteraceae bacterium]
MFNKYYQNELDKLRGLAKEFARVHPAAAPMLTSESVDPDVERLLEGTAFLTGHLQHKIDDDFPEIIHGLMDIVYPHYLRPVPSISIISFTPKPSLIETISVPAGTFLSSKEQNGIKCMFQTCFDLDVHPLRIVSAKSSVKEKKYEISISFQLAGISLPQWNTDKLAFFISGSYAKTSDIFSCFTQFISKIKIVTPNNPEGHILPESDFKSLGFDKDNSIFSYPAQSFSGFSLLQEYFIFPQKFLFFELSGLKNWKNRPDSNQFEIVFELNEPTFDLPGVTSENFSLFSVPVVNIFPFEAEPVVVDHTKEKIRIRPSSKTGTGHQIYSVNKVIGYSQGSVKPIDYVPMDYFSFDTQHKSFYKAARQMSPVTNTYEVYLNLTYAKEKTEYKQETLTIDLTCTNGAEPEQLMPGDICEHTSNSPELLNFKNITAPTTNVEPPLEGDTLWRLLSHMSLNLLSLKGAQSLREMLQLYIFPDSRDKGMVTANLKRINGISDFTIETEDRLIKGMVVRGEKITISLSKEGFASLGDVVVFGAVIDEFFSRYSSINSYTRLIINETISGESFSWLPRIGNKHLK